MIRKYIRCGDLEYSIYDLLIDNIMFIIEGFFLWLEESLRNKVEFMYVFGKYSRI